MVKILNYLFATFIYGGLLVALYGNKPLIAVSYADDPSDDPSVSPGADKGSMTRSIDRLAISI